MNNKGVAKVMQTVVPIIAARAASLTDGIGHVGHTALLAGLQGAHCPTEKSDRLVPCEACSLGVSSMTSKPLLPSNELVSHEDGAF